MTGPALTRRALLACASRAALLACAGFIALAGTGVASRAHAQAQAQAAPSTLAAPRWHARFQGVDTARIELEQPRRLVLHVARVDLQAPGLRWFATPAGDPAAPLAPPGRHTGETAGLRTSTFLRLHGLQLAINAAPFGPVVDEEGLLLDVAGLQVSQRVVVSGQTKEYPALLLMRDGSARIVAPPFELRDVDNAVGGFDIVLRAGRALFEAPGGGAADGGRRVPLHPRTAVGIARGGRELLLLVVDGRQEGYSLGVALHELAALLQALGATEGINLDGGGTSTLVVQGPDTEPLVLNRPIHQGVPGRERVSASHLGLLARPLPAASRQP